MFLDIATKKTYNVFCESIFMNQDAYRIKVCGWCSDDVIDECIMDSSGGIFMGESFSVIILMNNLVMRFLT